MMGGNLGAAVQMLKVINQQGGSQSWETTLYGQDDLNLWVKSGTRSGNQLPNSLSGDSVTILPMVAVRSGLNAILNTGITVTSNLIWVIRCRAVTVSATRLQGSTVSGQSTRFYFGTDADNKWRFGWGDATGLSSSAGLQDTNWHTIIMYDKRMWVLDPDISITDASILDVIATETPTVNHSAATWSGTEGGLYIGGYEGVPLNFGFEYALSYIGTITASVITWAKKLILYGTDVYDTLVADGGITWAYVNNISISYSQYGSDHMLNKGYTLLRDVSAYPKYIPNLEDGSQNVVTTLPTGFVIAAVIPGDENNYNLAPAQLSIPYSNFNKADTDIWEDIVRDGNYYDASNPYRWNGEELNRWNLVRKAKSAYDNIVFAKNDSNKLIELFSYNTNIDSNNISKVLQYIGENYYNYKIVFDKEYETADIEYKYSTQQFFYQKNDLVFTFNANGFIFYSEDGGETFPYIYEFADSANIQMCFIFANGVILFATRTKIYYSANKLRTVQEYTLKDTDNSNYVFHTPVSADYPGSYFSIVQNFNSFTIGGKEIFIWGNYANSIMLNGASPCNIYYSIDGGNPKIAYKFGVNPSYRDDGTDNGGAVGNDLGDASNPLYCRHVHSVAYNSDLNEFYVCTGDTTNECHWIKGTYNWNIDVWTWTNIVINRSPATRWKTGCIVYNSSDGYIYFTSDSTFDPHDYGLFKVLPANIGSSASCTTLAVFTNTASSFFINGTELCGRSAIEGDFIFYSKDLINISTETLTKPDVNRDQVVGIACNKNDEGFYKFNVSGLTPINYSNCVAVLIKVK